MTSPGTAGPAVPPAQANEDTVLRSPAYLRLLVVAAVLGVPISAAAYWFLVLSALLQTWLYEDLPAALNLAPVPAWWPLPLLGVGGVLVGATIRYVPGRGGEVPADGFKPGGGPPAPLPLLGIAVAALVGLGVGAVIGPEAPLIAIGAGLAAATVRLARRDTPAQALAVIAATGSFAAVSALLGSPLSGALMLMEAAGLAGPRLRPILLPGLLASGIGTLVFLGLDSWTGRGTFSLALPDLPTFSRPDLAQFGWAVVIGLGSAVLISGIRRLARTLEAPAERRILLAAPVTGLAVAGFAIAYAEVTGHPVSDVLFSGQDQLPDLVTTGAGYSVGALLLLLLCKSLAYAGSLAAFRGGPTFPALFLGVVAGILLSHLPGLSLVPAIAMGMGASMVAMLRLPLTSVLVATLVLGGDGLAAMPLVIVAVTVSYLASARLAPRPTEPDAAESTSEASTSETSTAEASTAETPGASGPVPPPRTSSGDSVVRRGTNST